MRKMIKDPRGARAIASDGFGVVNGIHSDRKGLLACIDRDALTERCERACLLACMD